VGISNEEKRDGQNYSTTEILRIIGSFFYILRYEQYFTLYNTTEDTDSGVPENEMYTEGAIFLVMSSVHLCYVSSDLLINRSCKMENYT
jgi:hypothetical protein